MSTILRTLRNLRSIGLKVPEDREYVQRLEIEADAHQEYGHQMQVCSDTSNASWSTRRGEMKGRDVC
jgi:hypothetical protein